MRGYSPMAAAAWSSSLRRSRNRRKQRPRCGSCAIPTAWIWSERSSGPRILEGALPDIDQVELAWLLESEGELFARYRGMA